MYYIHTSIKARINDFLRMIVSGGGLGQTVKRINKFSEFKKVKKFQGSVISTPVKSSRCRLINGMTNNTKGSS